jgi:hypothetical protein
MKSKTSISAIISYSIAGIYTADYHENMQRVYIYIEKHTSFKPRQKQIKAYE